MTGRIINSVKNHLPVYLLPPVLPPELPDLLLEPPDDLDELLPEEDLTEPELEDLEPDDDLIDDERLIELFLEELLILAGDE